MATLRQFWQGGVGDTLPTRLRRLRDDKGRRYLRVIMEEGGQRAIDLYAAVNARLRAADNERICAVCLTKRLAPVLVFAPVYRWEPDDSESPLRFPSTTAIAWVDQKERPPPRPARLLRIRWPSWGFPQGGGGVADVTGLARGRHWFGAYDQRRTSFL